MYAIGDVLCTGTGHRTKGLSEHMHRSQSDRLLQGGSLIFLALFDFPCQGAYITCSIGYQFVWVRCDAMRCGRGWVHLMYRIPTLHHTLLNRHLHCTLYHILYVLLCANEKESMRGMTLSHTDSSPDPRSLKPPKYASFMQIENDASSVVLCFFSRCCFCFAD